jgi:hypothetical protein
MIGIGGFITLYYGIKLISDPPSKNPAITRQESDDIVAPATQHE